MALVVIAIWFGPELGYKLTYEKLVKKTIAETVKKEALK